MRFSSDRVSNGATILSPARGAGGREAPSSGDAKILAASQDSKSVCPYDGLETWVSSLSKPGEELDPHGNQPGVGLGFDLHSNPKRLRFFGGDSGSLIILLSKPIALAKASLLCALRF